MAGHPRDVTMRDADGNIVGTWSREAWGQMQAAMRANDRTQATTIYDGGTTV